MALLAMIPNVGPIAIVFGLLGWFGEPVDIGTMMTASIALGIAVDGTLHQMVTYQRRLRHRADPVRAAAWALLRTGSPILGAAIITSVGMSALAVSPFAPTARFGILMAVLTIVAAFGDLCLLPALLSWGARKHAPGRERLYALSARRATRPAYRKTA
jgi:predicted RND superfamily exporter protein